MKPFEGLRGKFDVIVIDVPWHFATRSAKGRKKSAPYRTQRLDWIKALPVKKHAAKDCVVFFWATGWSVAEGFATDVLRAWGAKPVTEIVWLKRTASGKLRVGTGYWARSCHEPIIVATFGRPKLVKMLSAFDGIAREHSVKPGEFYARLRTLTPGRRRCDIFSRQSRTGFIGWGNEHGKLDNGGTFSRKGGSRTDRRSVDGGKAKGSKPNAVASAVCDNRNSKNRSVATLGEFEAVGDGRSWLRRLRISLDARPQR